MNIKTLLVALVLLVIIGMVVAFFSMKDVVYVTFDSNGGALNGVDGPVTTSMHAGEELTSDSPKLMYYEFDGWYTEAEGGEEVTEVPNTNSTVYAHWISANKDRTVKISNLKVGKKNNTVRISRKEQKNKIKVTFTLNQYFGQMVAFVDKNGEVLEEILSADDPDQDYGHEEVKVTCYLPDRNWMNKKTSTYLIKSMANEHVDETKVAKLKIKLAGQYEHFDRPIEGSMVWYGGTADAPKDRAGIIAATDDDYVYVRRDGEEYKWEKGNCMINLPEVLSKRVYDIYHAYDSRFDPISGLCMYSDNGKAGIKRYKTVDQDDATHTNAKTGATTFMVPVQWDFAETIAQAQSRAEDSGYTLYIVDTFRPMDSVDPVADELVKQLAEEAADEAEAEAEEDENGKKKKVTPKPKTPLLQRGGVSAHSFGLAVDCGWQKINDKGEPVGEPYDENLQVLDNELAVEGPNGNSAQSWWSGVPKLPQMWWQYGNGSLPAAYSSQAKAVGSLYVNEGSCISCKRSQLR